MDNFRDSNYIPRPNPNTVYVKAPGQSWGDAAREWLSADLEAKRRLERTLAQLEPLRRDWEPSDLAYLASWRIQP